MMRKPAGTSLPAPYLRRLWLNPDVERPDDYPFNLPWLRSGGFELDITTPVTLIVGENGTGKSTLIEAIAALCGFDEAGGGKGYRPIDHSSAVDKSGAALAAALRAAWLPKRTDGWFFKAESFFSVARYLDAAALDVGAVPPDFLSWSHGEGFVRFFEERVRKQGIYLMDEPESALSPRRQLELLRLLHRVQQTASAQIIIATHSPILMAVPGARLLGITRGGLAPTTLLATSHFRLYQDFTSDPDDFISRALEDDADF